MTGICPRLFAAVLSIIVRLVFVAPISATLFVAPTSLRAQDAARAPAQTPALLPILAPLRYIPPVAPVVIPLTPGLPSHHPVGPGAIVLQQVFFQQLVHAAGIIFSGRVTNIGYAASSLATAPASTAVTFQVQQAIRGTSPGQILTIHEWAGLWSSAEHYRVGESVLLFLYSPSKLGLTSPVAGALGRFEVDSQGQIVMNAPHVAIFAADPILGGKTIVPYSDFAQAVRRAREE
jgi:hypothetical protein